jgi:hypothetical protein
MIHIAGENVTYVHRTAIGAMPVVSYLEVDVYI